jgi:hypothetical protein
MKKTTFLILAFIVGLTANAQAPANDLIADAIDIDQFAQPYVDTGVDPSMGTAEPDPTNGCNLDGGAPPFVWYKFTATVNGSIDVTYSDLSGNPGAPIYNSSNGEDATAVDLNFETGNGNNTCGPSGSTSISTLAGATYYIAVTNGGPLDVTIDVSTSVLSVDSDIFSESISVYPNPTTGDLNVDFARNFGTTNIDIINISGQRVLTASVEAIGNKRLGTSKLSSGVYFANISNGTESTTVKFIKN